MTFTKDLLLTREWISAAALFAAALVGIAVLKYILGRVKINSHWAWIGDLIPYILNLGYAIAISLFFENAPIDHRFAVWIENAIYVLIVWYLLVLLRRSLLLAVEWSTQRVGTSKTLQNGFVPLIRNVVTLFAFVIGGIMVLKHFGYDVVSLLTALGVGSLAVGLAAKETLSNMISGFVLIMDHNVRPGDRINFGGAVGDVEEIGLRSTRIRSGDGNTVIVPNSDLVNNRIINLSTPTRATTCSTRVRVPASADFQKMKETCVSILKSIPLVDGTKNPWVNLVSLADGHQLLEIGCWVREMDDASEVLTQFHKQLLAALRSSGIPLIENAAFQQK